MGVALKCLPLRFLFRVGEEDTLLASQDSLQKRDVGSVEREGIIRALAWDFVRGSDEPANRAAGIPYWKSPHPDPAHLTAGPYDPEPLVELPGLRGLFEFAENASTIFRMDRLFIRRWVLFQALAGASGYGFIGAVDVESLLGGCINHPEDFLNIVRHLLELVFRCQESAGCLAMLLVETK